MRLADRGSFSLLARNERPSLRCGKLRQWTSRQMARNRSRLSWSWRGTSPQIHGTRGLDSQFAKTGIFAETMVDACLFFAISLKQRNLGSERMKRNDKNGVAFPFSNEQLEELRNELLGRISLEELDCSWGLQALDRISSVSQVDPVTFDQFWLKPLLAAGISRKVAIACIADACLWPN